MFPLGRIVATAGALKVLEEHPIDVWILLRRHRAGDWSEMDSEDREANRQALVLGHRILSRYTVGNERVWIITEWDRSYTTIMLPSEY